MGTVPSDKAVLLRGNCLVVTADECGDLVELVLVSCGVSKLSTH